MPIYDFRCTDCGLTKEKLVSSATAKTECPGCGAQMERQISGAQSFYFKGVGAYCEKSMNKTTPK